MTQPHHCKEVVLVLVCKPIVVVVFGLHVPHCVWSSCLAFLAKCTLQFYMVINNTYIRCTQQMRLCLLVTDAFYNGFNRWKEVHTGVLYT